MINLQNCSLSFDIKAVLFDFDGVFTDNSVWVDENGCEYVKCSRYDGFGISALHSAGIFTCVLTTETKPLASLRCQKLRLQCFDSLNNKLAFASQILEQHSIDFSNTVFVGNDINDLELLSRVGLPIVTPDSHLSVHSDDFYVTSCHGGHGCVREVADFILQSCVSPRY